jgi:general stress protein 26
MKTEPQNSVERTRLCELIKDIPVAMLTTLDGDGTLVSRPMSPLEMDGLGALWFFTDVRSSKTEQLQVLNLSFVDPARSTYVSLSGHGEIHTDNTRIERLWTPFARPWFPDGPDSDSLRLLKVVPETAEVWDAPHSRMVRMFAMAASVVAGKNVGLGKHATLASLSEDATVVAPK